MDDKIKIDKDVAWRIVDGQLFAVTVDGNLHNVDSPVGVAVWSLIDQGEGSVEKLLEHVLAEFDVDRTTAESDLREFLDHLKQLGVLA